MKPKSIDLKGESIRAALLALYESRGLLSPADVVESARDESSPLHAEFEWDDADAAEAYRLAQAGVLIRRVRLHVIKMNPKTKAVVATVTRQFQSRPSQRGSNGGYETIDDILSDEDKRGELLRQVLTEMRAYRKRYAELNELHAVWDAIAEAEESLLASRGGSEDRPSAPAA